MHQPSAPETQPHITFIVRGLGDKETRLFKSFVRLVSHRLSYQWTPSEDAAEVCVCTSPHLRGGSTHVLLVAPAEHGAPGCLRMPFQASEVEQALDALSAAVMTRRAQPQPVRPTGTERVKLNRWPPAQLLTSPQRLRLATAMTGRQVTTLELAQRTSVPLEACRAFAAELLHAGYAVLTQDPLALPAMSTHRSRPQLGLLARIRNRLSLA